MTSAIGRLVTDVQTNKSGGAVAYGDVVINDGSNSHAFTTTTSAGFTAGVVGVCIEPNGIANNASGRIQYQGYCAQVNTNASVTNSYFLKTHTVAKQAAGSSTRVVGSFGVAMATGSNPPALLWGFPDATSATGNVATDAIWDAVGDLAVGTGADTAAKLAISVPAANILNVLGVVNGETTWSVKPIHDGTAPVTQAFGDSAAAGTALTAAHRDHKHGMPASPSGLIVSSARVAITSGNKSLTSTTWANLDTAMDLTCAAANGDIIEVSMSGLYQNVAQFCFIDAMTLVSGAGVHWLGSGEVTTSTGNGVPGWAYGSTNQYQPLTGSKQLALVSGDISGGNVVIRFRYRVNGGTVTLRAASGDALYAEAKVWRP